MYQVVIVEDDPMVAMLNRRYTEKDTRFTVVKEFKTGQSALDYLTFKIENYDELMLPNEINLNQSSKETIKI